MYTIYSILSLVFVILIIVTAFITIALTYFQLAVEDHRWWWRSFLCGGSTGAERCSGLAIYSTPHSVAHIARDSIPQAAHGTKHLCGCCNVADVLLVC